jgi:filamentous hemagglutinin
VLAEAGDGSGGSTGAGNAGEKELLRNPDGTMEFSGAESKIKSGSFDELPVNAKNAYKGYEENGWQGNYSGQAPGTAAGGKYNNFDSKLPTTDSTGNLITYKEFDVNNYVQGAERDAERFLTGSDGSMYYTNDHYGTFTKIK